MRCDSAGRILIYGIYLVRPRRGLIWTVRPVAHISDLSVSSSSSCPAHPCFLVGCAGDAGEIERRAHFLRALVLGIKTDTVLTLSVSRVNLLYVRCDAMRCDSISSLGWTLVEHHSYGEDSSVRIDRRGRCLRSSADKGLVSCLLNLATLMTLWRRGRGDEFALEHTQHVRAANISLDPRWSGRTGRCPSRR